MRLMITGLRRVLWLVLIGAALGAVWTWIRDRRTPPAPPAPPQWPPLTSVRPAPSAPTMAATSKQSSAASIVNALVDAPEARSRSSAGRWVAPNEDGSCPSTHPIKANDNSGIYHVPGGRFYDRTRAERCYTTEDAAVADGYRAAKA